MIVPLYKQALVPRGPDGALGKRPADLRSEDLIYVLDSPEQADVLDELAHGLYSIYGIPFRIAVMKGNAGFAAVNNRAVELARAEQAAAAELRRRARHARLARST